ncbi:MAG: Fur family transcriptional regulator [Anaerolineae bacterium]
MPKADANEIIATSCNKEAYLSCEKHFIDELRRRGLRLTPQREAVLDVLHTLNGLSDAETIAERVHDRIPTMDISTVYRTLHLLQDLALVVCIDTGAKGRRYKLLTPEEPHIHLVCQGCCRLATPSVSAAAALSNSLQEAYGFTADLSQLTVPGWCDRCTPNTDA